MDKPNEPVTLRFPGFPPIKGVGEPITAVEKEPFEDSSYYTYSLEAKVEGIQYVTVLDEGGNPIEYEIPYMDAYARYGDESWPEPV